jgi:ferredoxin--NADP+ reductase
MKPLNEIVIINKNTIAEKVFIIEFKRNFDFKPGQIIGITNKKTLAPRLYSICSAPSDENISILFNVKDDGELTPPLAEIMPGDKIWITPVQGKFIFQNEPAWWIATGTGIAPFFSMFKRGQKPLKLIQGGRFKTDMYFSESFASLDDYVRCCSKDWGEGVFEGRLTKYLEDFSELPTNINYYLCGSAEMVVDVRELLIAKGVPYKNIITEIYF